MKKIIATAGILSFLISGISFAADKAPIKDRPCQSDMEKLCKDVKPGEGRKIQCIHEHKDQLSQECKDQLKAKHEERNEHWKACKEDKEKFCKGVKPGEGHIRDCLKAHKNALSKECQARF